MTHCDGREYLEVTMKRGSDRRPRGHGWCHNENSYAWKQRRYFSDSGCRHWEERTSELEVGKGGKKNEQI